MTAATTKQGAEPLLKIQIPGAMEVTIIAKEGGYCLQLDIDDINDCLDQVPAIAGKVNQAVPLTHVKIGDDPPISMATLEQVWPISTSA